MMKNITINPITRLEGHGKIEIFLNDNFQVERAYLQPTEFRGFEKFCEGRPAEEMPRITTRICGVCPTAHHIASVKALDMLFDVEPTATGKKLRELMYSIFVLEDHLLHFFFLGGPDFIVGPTAPKGERNILGVLSKVGVAIGKQVISLRGELRKILNTLGGKAIHPESALPGGISRGINEETRKIIEKTAEDAVKFTQFTLETFEEVVLKNKTYLELIKGDVYCDKTYYMGLVDQNKKVNFYNGNLRVVTPDGKEFASFSPVTYLDHIGEHVESWSYSKFPFLKRVGWKGFVGGDSSGIFRVGPLARFNVAEGMATPLAQGEYEKMVQAFGQKPVHNTMAYHWARLVEALYAAESMLELCQDPDITGREIRNLPTGLIGEGVGVVEAPRGTLIHHYKTNGNAIITDVNLIVATQNNAAAINMSVEKAAKSLIKKDNIDDGILNMVEMAFRAYDPCYGCATHTLPGQFPLTIHIRNQRGELIKKLSTAE
ncbi:MAG: Ni/Fe hydrogenase subunit alpha [Candidatus Tectomicrobia bacterium]|uniref:Ni/Fe hydrogenase subunit alpha n=1 Tax=Tectimicrobiota bacterium TaxID=2528274 RepID=A0A933LQ77_UNCTE|nr:Ni/Fe hydrogenase subunit alpha [Candidatus Tectomicrobia bacterium]